ncbi:hypothetical protein SDC9_208185 [bioreactor metagenome]|uniref:Uncharacterized protein n=1 Tax=bioreactor metagenome TaxID=1076179 RepID=A0A645JAM8_9ZZZZ
MPTRTACVWLAEAARAAFPHTPAARVCSLVQAYRPALRQPSTPSMAASSPNAQVPNAGTGVGVAGVITAEPLKVALMVHAVVAVPV